MIKKALLIALAIALGLAIAGFLWWTGDAFCIGSMSKCIGY
jgi:hypothetical protein